jgi:hypothetical protein
MAVAITRAVGSMHMAYAFAALSFIMLPAAILSRSPIILISWLSQTFLQLVLLPIIIVGQNVQAAATDHRDEEDHHMLERILTLLEPNDRELHP